MESLSDHELVARIQAGESDFFTTLLNRHIESVYRYLYRTIGGAPVDIDDVVQQTFIKVWRHIGKFKPAYNFRSWLFTIAHHTAIDYLRRKQPVVFSRFETPEGENVLLDTIPDQVAMPDIIIENQETRARLESAILELPLLYREIFLLHFEEELTFNEISAIVHKPLDTVKSQYRRALLLLRKSLQQAAPNTPINS